MAYDSSNEPRIFGLSMLQQILLAIVAGVLLGWAAKVTGQVPYADFLAVFGTIFLKLIKMVVAPLIFFALISGITSLTNEHHFKGIAFKGVVAYISTCTLAVIIGLLLGTIFKPGVGVPLEYAGAAVTGFTVPATTMNIGEFLQNLIPHNIVNAMANDIYLQIVIFAVFTGVVMNNISGNTKMVKDLNQQMAHIVFKMIEWIVRLAPLAVFGFTTSMVAKTGLDGLVTLGELILLVVFACVVQYGLLGLIIKFFGRVSPMPFYRKIFPTQVMAFSTSSSKATLSMAMRELQDKMGVSQSTSNFMMPLGACINMDGTAIYLGIIATFFAQMYGIDLGYQEYLTLVLSCTLGSIGAAGIPGGSIIFMGMVLSSVGIPIEGIGMILGIDRILDMLRTAINITGDATITLVVDSMEGQLDEKTYHKKLS